MALVQKGGPAEDLVQGRDDVIIEHTRTETASRELHERTNDVRYNGSRQIIRYVTAANEDSEAWSTHATNSQFNGTKPHITNTRARPTQHKRR